MSKDYWTAKHTRYSKEDWIKIPSLFAEETLPHLPKNGSMLELGAGHGQDSVYFAEHGHTVTSTDIETASLTTAVSGANPTVRSRISIMQLNISTQLPFDDATFDIVYAHLSLHYFDHVATVLIFNEISRVLRPNGTLAFLVNSTHDPEYEAGTKIDKDCFSVEGELKHFFSKATAMRAAKGFTPIIADDKGQTYKDNAKGVHGLIRYIGHKT